MSAPIEPDNLTSDAGAGAVRYERHGPVGILTFDRPAARNALTDVMYADLSSCLTRVEAEAEVPIGGEGGVEGRSTAGPPLRVVVLRGEAGTFVAGTDIARFTSFRTDEDGVRYERYLDSIVGRLEALPVPTLAVVEGWAAGAGLLLSAVCDLRICTPGARFGVPIARTVGNCLSMASTARLLAHFGEARAKLLLLAADFIGAEEAVAAGFVLEVVQPERLESRVAELCDRLASHSPITMAVSKEAIRRIIAYGLPDGDDLVRRAYGSRDFREGVAAFLAKRPPRWDGQ